MDDEVNIAYLDDEPTNVKIIQQALKTEYNISCFHHARGFLAADKSYPDLLLLDAQMPEMNGHEVCEALRAKGYDKPILFLSAYSGIKERLKGNYSGGDDYLTKPFNFDELNLNEITDDFDNIEQHINVLVDTIQNYRPA